jgi:hypothetical protein
LYAADDVVRHVTADTGQFRVFNPLRVYDGSYLMAHRIQTALGYHGNEVRFYDDLWGGKNEWRNQGSQQLWDLLAVRYVLLPSVQDIPGYSRVLGPVQTTPGSFAVLYQRDSAAPYVRVAPAAAVVPEEQLVPTIIDPRFPYNEVVLYPDTVSLSLPPLEALPAPTEVRADLAAWEPGRMTVTLEGSDERQTYLLVSETWFPDWSATVDGAEASVVRGQGALLSVPLPPGARQVELRFHSASYARGLMISLLATLVAIGLMVIPQVRERRARHA